jgi:hypothetical protein
MTMAPALTQFGFTLVPAQNASAMDIAAGAPLLLGVEHSLSVEEASDELLLVNRFLTEWRPTKLGLELPQDHAYRHSLGITNFFYELHKRHEALGGQSTIPLDDSEGLDRWYQTQIAKSLLATEADPIGQLETAISSLRQYLDLPSSPWAPPEFGRMRAWAKHQTTIFQGARELLMAGPTAEELSDRWWKCSYQRTDYMLGQIENQHPEVVIVGDGHAGLLAPKLSSYIYLRTPMAEESPIVEK